MAYGIESDVVKLRKVRDPWIWRIGQEGQFWSIVFVAASELCSVLKPLLSGGFLVSKP
jgi:hypothetical protein